MDNDFASNGVTLQNAVRTASKSRHCIFSRHGAPSNLRMKQQQNKLDKTSSRHSKCAGHHHKSLEKKYSSHHEESLNMSSTSLNSNDTRSTRSSLKKDNGSRRSLSVSFSDEDTIYEIANLVIMSRKDTRIKRGDLEHRNEKKPAKSSTREQIVEVESRKPRNEGKVAAVSPRESRRQRKAFGKRTLARQLSKIDSDKLLW